MDTATLEQQVRIILRALEGKSYEKSSPVYTKTLEWIGNWPRQVNHDLRGELITQACRAFSVTEAEILSSLAGENVPVLRHKEKSNEEELREILPKGGWFEWYDQYTRETESPLAFHVFSSLCVLGAALGRRVRKPMGHFDIFPNYCCVLIGPTGRVKKTSAADIAKKIVNQATLCPIFADKITPEGLASELSQKGGHQFIYAPELSVFFGRQKYNEGLVTNIIRMLDCPTSFRVVTQTRGEEEIQEPTLSILGCSTMALLTTSVPDEVTSSGFLNRFVAVVENDTDRCFPEPGRVSGRIEQLLIESASRLKGFSGNAQWSLEAAQWWDQWYRERWKRVRETAEDFVVEATQRGPEHVIRTALLMHVAQCDNLTICQDCLERAAKLVTFVERGMPSMLHALKHSNVGKEADFVLEVLIRLGGVSDHSTLLRRCAGKMNAAQFKMHIRTLDESGRVKITKRGVGTYYTLIGGGDS